MMRRPYTGPGPELGVTDYVRDRAGLILSESQKELLASQIGQLGFFESHGALITPPPFLVIPPPPPLPTAAWISRADTPTTLII